MANNSTIHSFSQNWLTAKFQFRDYTNPINYGLIADRVKNFASGKKIKNKFIFKTGARGLILSVQAFVLRHLLAKNLLATFKQGSVLII